MAFGPLAAGSRDFFAGIWCGFQGPLDLKNLDEGWIMEAFLADYILACCVCSSLFGWSLDIKKKILLCIHSLESKAGGFATSTPFPHISSFSLVVPGYSWLLVRTEKTTYDHIFSEKEAEQYDKGICPGFPHRGSNETTRKHSTHGFPDVLL